MNDELHTINIIVPVPVRQSPIEEAMLKLSTNLSNLRITHKPIELYFPQTYKDTGKYM